jgi:hypothetical protein
MFGTTLNARVDLAALGIRLGWVGPDDKEEPVVKAVMEQLRHEGADMLPLRGGTRVLVTANDSAWGKAATPIEIAVWSKDILISRTRREPGRTAAENLSETLGGGAARPRAGRCLLRSARLFIRRLQQALRDRAGGISG